MSDYVRLTKIKKIRDIQHIREGIEKYDFVRRVYLRDIDVSNASATIHILKRNGLYDELLSDIEGYDVDQSSILSLLQELMIMKSEYDRVSIVLQMVGYRYAIPQLDSIELSKPKIIKQGPRFGMKLKSKVATSYL